MESEDEYHNITMNYAEDSATKKPFWTKIKEGLRSIPGAIRSNRKIITTTLSILVLTATLGTGVLLTLQRQNTKTHAGGVDVTLSTNKASANIGDVIVVAVAINTNGLNVAATNLAIKYDPNILDGQSVQNGTFLPTTISGGKFESGTATITLGCLIDSTGSYPKSGTGFVASLTFKAKANGSVNISIDPSTGVAVIGQQSNALGTTNSVNITVGMTVNGSPTITPAPVNQPTPTATLVGTATPTPASNPTSSTSSCLPIGSICSGPGDTSCCNSVSCDLVRKSGGQYKCGVPID